MNEDLKQAIESAKEQQPVAIDLNWYQGTAKLDDVKQYIRANINSASRSFVAIGYYLKYVRDRELFSEDGYNTIWEFAQGEFGISRSTSSRFMAINDRFSKDGNSPVLMEQYKDFSSSKLSEMLTMSDGQLEQVSTTTTVAEIREIKNPDKVVATSQQEPKEDDWKDKVILDLVSRLTSVKQIDQTNGRPCEAYGEKYKAYSNIHDKQMTFKNNSGQLAFMVNKDRIKEVFKRINEAEVVQADIIQTESNYDFDRISKYDLLDVQITIWGLKKDIKAIIEEEIDAPFVKDTKMELDAFSCLEERLQKGNKLDQEQPDLPLLKNNDQRKAFIEAYETWPIWIETKETGERYYRYDFDNGDSMVIKVYYCKVFDYKSVELAYEERFRDCWGKEEYYLLETGKYFKDCETNKSSLVEYLKDLQKKGA